MGVWQQQVEAAWPRLQGLMDTPGTLIRHPIAFTLEWWTPQTLCMHLRGLCVLCVPCAPCMRRVTGSCMELQLLWHDALHAGR